MGLYSSLEKMLPSNEFASFNDRLLCEWTIGDAALSLVRVFKAGLNLVSIVLDDGFTHGDYARFGFDRLEIGFSDYLSSTKLFFFVYSCD